MNNKSNTQIGYKEIEQVERDFITWVKEPQKFSAHYHDELRMKLLVDKKYKLVFNLNTLINLMEGGYKKKDGELFNVMSLYYHYLKKIR